MADLHTRVLLSHTASCFQTPSVLADAATLALPRKVHCTLFRDTHGHRHPHRSPALSPGRSNAFSDGLFPPVSIILPSTAHPWEPLAQQAAFARSPRAV